MASFGRRGTARLALASVSTLAGVMFVDAAVASQGPGGGPGTAGSFTQLVMAVIVYGASALVVGAGLLGAVRQHFH